MSDQSETTQRSYGCSMGCGNPYDFIMVTVSDSTTLFLCVPCYVAQAADVVAAMGNPEDPEVKRRLEAAGGVEVAPMKDAVTRTRGHHAPAASDDPDLLDAYDGIVHEDELPEAFR